jgi:hypothetical protein
MMPINYQVAVAVSTIHAALEQHRHCPLYCELCALNAKRLVHRDRSPTQIHSLGDSSHPIVS